MRYLSFAVLMLMLGLAPAAARVLTDSAGRVVELPDSVGRVLAAGAPAAIVLYALAPEALVNWVRPPADPALVLPEARDLPVTGRLTEKGGPAGLEPVIALNPDLIVDYGTVSPRFAEGADRLQDRLGIPVLLVDGGLDAIPSSLRLLGEALDRPERAEVLAQDAEARLTRNDARAAALPAEARPRVWLARGPEGRETGIAGSINTEIIERAGAVNAAGPGDGSGGLVTASAEGILLADPQVVVAIDAGFPDHARADPVWAETAAGRAGRILLAPGAPFPWLDFPPSVNRLIGLDWMAAQLWPEAGIDLRGEARDFLALWYQVAPDEAQLDALLGR